MAAILLPAAGMATWSCSRDPILQRYGVGGIARLASAGPGNVAIAQRAGALPALVKGLNSSDAQAQCFASGAVGEFTPVLIDSNSRSQLGHIKTWPCPALYRSHCRDG